MSTKELLQTPIQERVELHKAHLVDMVVRGDRGKQVIEVYIDNETGVTSDLCAEVSRSLIDLIDRSGHIPGPYRLDVSSPGIDRPLRHAWQFRKHAGRNVEVTRSRTSGTESLRGVLAGCDDAGITLDPGSGASPQNIPYGQIVEVRVKAPW